MKTKLVSRIGAIALAAILVVPTVFAANPVTCKIPFAFHVGGKTLPSGDYTFQLDANKHSVTVMGKGKGADAFALVITELSASSHAEETHTRIVFDKEGDKYTLAEMWVPGIDGVLLAATKGKHEHHVLHVK